MRKYKLLTRTLLILSIINFVLAAPVAVRERAEVRIDATVTRSVTATSQKRLMDSEDEGELPLPNVPSPPPSPDILSQMPVEEQHMADPRRPPPDNLGSSAGPRLPVGLMPVAGSLSPPPESWSLNVPGQAHAPPQNLHSTHGSQRVGLSSAPPPSLDLTGLSQHQKARILLGLDPGPLRAPPSSSYTIDQSQKVPPIPGSTSEPRLPVPVLGSHSLPPGIWSLRKIRPADAAPQSLHSTHGSQRVGPLPPSARPQNLDLTGLSDYQKARILFGLNPGPPRARPPSSFSIDWPQKLSPNSGSSSGSRLPVGSMPVATSLSRPPQSWSLNVPGPARPSALRPSLDLTSLSEYQKARISADFHRGPLRALPRPFSIDWPQKVLPNPGSTSGPRLPAGSMPAASSVSRPPGSWSLNVPRPAHAPPPSALPPSQDLTGLSQYQKMRILFGLDPGPLRDPTPNPGSTYWSQKVPPNPGSTSGSRLPVGSMPVASSLPPSPESLPPSPESWLLPLDLSDTAHGPPQNLHSTHWSQGVGPSPPSAPPPSLDPIMHSQPNSGSSADKFWAKVLKESQLLGSMLAADSSSHSPLPLSHSSQPEPSEVRFSGPPGISKSVDPDTSPATGSAGNQPTLSGVDPETHSPPDLEPIPTDVLDKILNGKFKRRISSSDDVNLVQKDTRFLKFPSRRQGHDAAIPLHSPPS